MATYHCSVKVGAKGKGGPHSDYISREGKYKDVRSNEKLEHVESGNMPAWAANDPAQFWQAADQHERANGATYREIEIALPRELDAQQRLALVHDFVREEIGNNHAYTFALHTPQAAIAGGAQPHAHIMYSERSIDALQRDPEHYFKRFNAKNPEKGGCRKDSAGTEERLQATRECWAIMQNLHLKRHGHVVRVDHRSLKQQGIERTPEPHLGPARIKRMERMGGDAVAAILEQRRAEGAKERADLALKASIIDLSGDLAAAKAERARPPPAPALSKEAIAAGVAAARAQYELHKQAEAGKAQARQAFAQFKADQERQQQQEQKQEQRREQQHAAELARAKQSELDRQHRQEQQVQEDKQRAAQKTPAPTPKRDKGMSR